MLYSIELKRSDWDHNCWGLWKFIWIFWFASVGPDDLVVAKLDKLWITFKNCKNSRGRYLLTMVQPIEGEEKVVTGCDITSLFGSTWTAFPEVTQAFVSFSNPSGLQMTTLTRSKHLQCFFSSGQACTWTSADKTGEVFFCLILFYRLLRVHLKDKVGAH